MYIEKVNPGNDNRQENWRYPRRFRRPRQEQQQPYSDYRRYGEFRYRSGFQPTSKRGPQYYQEMWRYAPRRRRFFERGSNPQRPAQAIGTREFYKPQPAGYRLLERKRTRKLAQRNNKNASLINKEDILKRRIMNLSSRTLTKSETDLLHKGLNFCPTPPPPRKEEINDDIDAFARRLNLKEYHAPEEKEDIADNPTRQHRLTTLEKLNQNGHKGPYRPPREPYLNTYVENIRQNIIEELTKKRRFQRNNLN